MTTTTTTKSNGKDKAQAPPATAEPMAVVQLPIGALRESPTNNRTRWGNLEELAASMGNGIGIVQPLTVRPWPKGASINAPAGHRSYEIVYGARRYRAGKIAKLTAAPCIVRDLTDDELLDLQLLENMHREDLHPIDEARDYDQLRKRGKTLDQIAGRVGRSRSHVLGRLQLLKLAPPCLKDFEADKLVLGVAQRLARMPEHVQAEAWATIKREHARFSGRDEPVDGHEADRVLNHHYMLQLGTAPFDTSDRMLVPAAGACTTCPKRTGNQAELFADVKTKDTCTDPQCFAAKREAGEAKAREAYKAKGVEILKGVERHGYTYPPEGYVELSQSSYDLPSGHKLYGKTYGQVLKAGKVAVEPAVYFKDGKAQEVVPKRQLPSLLKAAGVKRPAAAQRSIGGSGPSKAAIARERIEKAAAKAARPLVLAALTKGQAKPDALWRIVGQNEAYLGKAVLAKLAGGKLLAAVWAKLLDHDYQRRMVQALAAATGVDWRALVKAATKTPAKPKGGKRKG